MLVWNVNGLSEAARALFDTCEYLQQFPIVALTETQRPDFAPPLLRGYEHFAVPSPRAGRRGYGLAVYVHETLSAGVSVWRQDAELSVLWLRFSGALFGVDTPVFCGVVYLPPVGSHRLQVHQGLDERYIELASHVGQAQAMGKVLMCGDFNASVSSDGQVGLNAPGRKLIEFCQSCDVQLLTGCLEGDQPAVPSFGERVHTGASRPDHVLASPELVSVCHSLHVDSGRLDSDHFPLCLSFAEDTLGGVAHVGHDRHDLRVFSRLRWDRECCDAYQQLMLSDDTLEKLAAARQTLHAGGSADAAGMMQRTLMGVARGSGMMQRTPRLSRGGVDRVVHTQKPWFDSQCRQLKVEVSILREHVVASRGQGVNTNAHVQLRAARRAFNCAARQKRRAYRRQHMQRLLDQLRWGTSSKRFWDALALPQPRMPPHLRRPSVWTEPMRRALNPRGPLSHWSRG